MICLLTGLATGVVGCNAPPEQSVLQLTESAATSIQTSTYETLLLPEGYRAKVIVDGLVGPTQMIKGPDEHLWIAQYAGAEHEGVGEILSVDLVTGKRETLVDGLKNPTGIAIVGGYLWIATERDLWRAALDEAGRVGTPERILRDLPYDGRSNGTLTVTPSRDLLYETSGARFGGSPLDGSATLWQLDPANPTHPVALATGLHSAYAHTFYGEDGLWFTEISQDMVNGRPPPDELNFLRVKTDAIAPDYGWPKCYGDRQPAHNYGGDYAYCAMTESPTALFESHSAPTSIVLSPWEDATLLVAFSGTGDVARISVDLDGDIGSGALMSFISGMRKPQHLLLWNTNTLLVSDHERGEIIAVEHEADG